MAERINNILDSRGYDKILSIPKDSDKRRIRGIRKKDSAGEVKEESEVEDGNLNDERGSDKPIEGEGSEEVQTVEEGESTDELGGRGEQDDTQQLSGDTGQQSADQQLGSQRTGDGRASLNQNNHSIKREVKIILKVTQII